METVARATDEDAILQIEMQDLEDAKRLLDDFSQSFIVIGDHAPQIIEVCREELKRVGRVSVAVVVISGSPEQLRLEHCTAVFGAFTQSLDESVFQVFGVTIDPTLQSGVRVTCLTGASAE